MKGQEIFDLVEEQLRVEKEAKELIRMGRGVPSIPEPTLKINHLGENEPVHGYRPMQGDQVLTLAVTEQSTSTSTGLAPLPTTTSIPTPTGGKGDNFDRNTWSGKGRGAPTVQSPKFGAKGNPNFGKGKVDFEVKGGEKEESVPVGARGVERLR